MYGNARTVHLVDRRIMKIALGLAENPGLVGCDAVSMGQSWWF